MGKYKNRAVSYDGHEFDSLAELDFYKEVQRWPDVSDIELHPSYPILDEHHYACYRCNRKGKVLNDKTGNLNKCTLCKGSGYRKGRGAIYTADALVAYKDGSFELFDVKQPHTITGEFSLRRRLFQSRYGAGITVVQKVKGKWVYKR